MTADPSRPPARRGSRDAGDDDGWRRRRDRAQSHVVGVSLMIGITVLALGTLTVTIGSVVESGAASAEADRVAEAMTVVADPADVVGTAEAELRFGEGRLTVERRTIRMLEPPDGTAAGGGGGGGGGGNASASGGANQAWTTLDRVDSDALVYEVGDWRVVGAGGAVLQAGTGGATMVSEPSIVADRAPGGVLVAGAPALDAPELSVSTSAAARIGLRSNVTHERRDLGERRIRVAVETEYPRPWVEYFRRQNATLVDRDRSLDADGVDSVVVEFAGTRRTYLVVHRAEVEVTGG